MRIIFMGTPDFSVSALDALHKAGHQIVAVYSQPPRPAGRGKKLKLSAVHMRADALGLHVETPLNFKSQTDVDILNSFNADIAVVVAYGLLLPISVLEVPKKGCLNIHASLLPRWRGAAPIHRAIMAGDTQTGISIMQMDKGLDTGAVLMRETMPITVDDTTDKLHDQLSEMGARLIVKTLTDLDHLTPATQPDKGVTYAKKISKDEARINWSMPSEVIDQTIRGLSKFPGAWFELNGERVKVLMSLCATGDGPAGQLLDDQLTVACGTGAVRLLSLQRSGKKQMSADDFQRGHNLPEGSYL